ncbi:type II secretion system protein [Anaerorhabdus sp.]|uniref:type II secretion system protein n=1 Tax=Anaerorhabdus sp. TaxID=1872524 RepID=UPI002FCA8143
MNKLKKGFTLVELIVVIAVLAVLGMLIVPQVTGAIDESQRVTCMNNLNLIKRAYLTAKASDETVSMTTVIGNSNGKYYLGKSECPKSQDEYGRQYLDDLWCPYHKISTLGTLSIYDEYVAGVMDDLLIKIEKCGVYSTHDERNTCVNKATNGLISRYVDASNTNLRNAIIGLYGNKEWPPIDNNLLAAAKLDVTTKYYYQPYFTDNKTELLFASKDSTGHGQWSTNLIFYQGQWYKYNGVGSKTNISVTEFQTLSAQQIRDKFNSSEFSKVDY